MTPGHRENRSGVACGQVGITTNEQDRKTE